MRLGALALRVAAVVGGLGLGACDGAPRTPATTSGATSSAAQSRTEPTGTNGMTSTKSDAPLADPSASATALPTGSAAAPIGAATMEADGTLVLMLRAEGPSGAVGDAQFRYPPSHPQYQKMLKHVGGMKPGESKPVPPWPEGE
ncbi:MAG: hypothetical protein HY908_37365 [Myxococcales bacterium]|nr:hypothetical protein [Myxococcales bacterium]